MLAYKDGRLVKASLGDIAEAAYMLIQLVPPGRVTTYGSIARLLGVSPRLIGRILASNKRPIIIPCHRVVKSDGSLGGYSMKGGVGFKERLLRLEGVRLTRNKRIPRENIIDLCEELCGGKN